uniref:Uncharacterized protein n=1 Tax=Ananas comosus var. bracteatus TaxID=296719 RepID=A0A6V7PY14_ANACO|nr:unnamed protein product [Ananas comosus var. bracteatus]
MGSVSPRVVALGDRSHPPGTGCLADCRNTVPRGPVSPIRDRSPRVKTLRTCQNSRDRTFRSEYHLRPSTKCGKARNPYQTLEPRNLHRLQTATWAVTWRERLKAVNHYRFHVKAERRHGRSSTVGAGDGGSDGGVRNDGGLGLGSE